MTARTVGRAKQEMPPAVSLVRLVHPFPSLLVSLVTVVLVRVADADAGVGLYVQLGLGMLLFQFAIGVANDVVDAETDAATKAWKALPRGLVSKRRATLLAAGLAGAGLVVTSTLETGAWLIGLAGLSCGLLYDGYFKRTALSWLPYSVALPLVPVWVFVAADAWVGMMWWVFPLGAALGLALHLANQAPDVAADRTVGVRGAAQRMSGMRSRGLAIGLFGLSSAVAVVVLAFASPASASIAAADALLAALLAPRATAFFGRDGLFGLLAMATGVLAVVFVGAV